MKHIVRKIVSLIFILILPGCSMFIDDCTKYSNDQAAYHQCSASQGSQSAQYELGLEAYNAQDYKTALKWLKLAAIPNSGRTAIYMPPVGGQQYGSVMMMDTGQATAGHSGAQSLLADMYERGLGVKVNQDMANHYRKMAGKNTFPNVNQ